MVNGQRLSTGTSTSSVWALVGLLQGDYTVNSSLSLMCSHRSGWLDWHPVPVSPTVGAKLSHGGPARGHSFHTQASSLAIATLLRVPV